MIDDLKFKIPVKEGSITSGIKAISERTKKEYPKAIDYFNVDDFPEIINAYGKMPKKLVVFFPTNKPEDFLDINYVLYGSNNQLIRKCDGKQCFHRIDEEIENTQYKAGSYTGCICKDLDLQKEHKKRCKPFFWMKAFIGDIKLGRVDQPMCYLFKSGSKNSAENIISELNKVSNLTNGNIVGIPFGLSVEMVQSGTEAGKKFPIWKLEGLGSITQMKQWNEAVTMLIPKKSELKQLSEYNVPPDDMLFSGEEEHQTDNADMEREIREKQNPEYWIKAIGNLTTYNQLVSFEKEFHLELTMFGGGDEQLLKKAIEDKRKQLLNK